MKVSRRIKGSGRALAVFAAGVLTASFATLAPAASFPAQHFSLIPLGGEPLQQGFVAVVVTNASGNGRADAVHDPELLAALGLRGLTIGGTVTLLHEAAPAYTTGCKVIQLD